MPSLGLIYNNEIRNTGTPVYCWDALVKLGINVWHYLPSGRPIRENAPDFHSHDAYLYLDDGRDDLGVPDLPQPCGYWAIDTHLGFAHRFAMAQQMQWVFTAQTDGAALMKIQGIDSAQWLPLACHPLAHPAIPIPEKLHDLAFVGFLNSDYQDCPPDRNNRIVWLDHLFKAFPNSWLATSIWFEEMALVYCQAKLGFNISIKRDLNMRFFEILCTGTPLLTNTTVDGWQELGFVEGQDFIGYATEQECIDKARYYLDHPDERLAIAASGMKKARLEHTYAHRMVQILDTMGFDAPRCSPVEANPPNPVEWEAA